MADAYKLKADVSLPRAIREIEELADGTKVYETVGVNYVAGTYVLAESIAPFVREKADNGELDHLLEAVSVDEAKGALDFVEVSAFIAEHEAEAVVLEDAGHEVVPREQLLELLSAGSGDAKSALEAGKEDGKDERPALSASEVPSLAEVSADGKLNVATGQEKVDEQKLSDQGVEQSPGIPVGEVKELAEGGSPAAKRGRPRKANAGEVAQAKSPEQSKAEKQG